MTLIILINPLRISLRCFERHICEMEDETLQEGTLQAVFDDVGYDLNEQTTEFVTPSTPTQQGLSMFGRDGVRAVAHGQTHPEPCCRYALMRRLSETKLKVHRKHSNSSIQPTYTIP